MDVYDGDPCGDHEYVTGVWTDVDAGTYTINGIPAGTYFLKTSPWYSNYITEYWDTPASNKDCSAAEMVTVTAGVTQTGFDFQLDSGGSISGVVRDYLGDPIEGLWVQAFPEKCNGDGWIGATTDANGLYTIRALPADSYFVQACPTCHGQAFVNAWWTDPGGTNPGGTHDCNAAEPVDVQVNQTHTNIDFTLSASGSITGRVTSGGEPVGGLWIEVWADRCWNGWLNGSSTDENGYYTVDGLPVGEVYVRTCAECDALNYIDRWYTPDRAERRTAIRPKRSAVVASSTTGHDRFRSGNKALHARALDRGFRSTMVSWVSGSTCSPASTDLIVSATVFPIPTDESHEFDIENGHLPVAQRLLFQPDHVVDGSGSARPVRGVPSDPAFPGWI